MRIKKIKLTNGYKRFFDLTIDLGDSPSKVVALVGLNGLGKSSVLDGMLYLQSKYSHIGISAISDRKYHSVDDLPSFDTTWRENVQIEFTSGNFETVFAQKQALGQGKTLFNFRSPYRYSSSLQVEQLNKVSKITDNNIGAGATSQLDQKIIDSYQRIYIMIDHLIKEDGSTFTYQQAKDKVLGLLNQSLREVLDIEISDHGNILSGRGTFYFKKSDQQKEFDFNVLSSGEKEVVDILLDFFLKKDEFNDSIYIIDEPELHINTNVQRKLLEEIVKIIPDSCQLWVATHSIGFLNALKQDYPDDSSIIWFNESFVTSPVTLKPMTKSRSNWKKVFETALEDLTGLISPKTIVYCEGRKESSSVGAEQGFDANVYNIIFEKKYPDILFISSGGHTEPDKYSEIALKILNKAFDGVTMLLLKDKDINGSGDETSDEQRLHWIAEEPTSRRMLERKEIENYLFDFEILLKLKPDLDILDYNLIVTDIKDENVKDKGAEIKVLCGQGQVSLEDFKFNLASLVTSETVIFRELERIILNN